MSTPVKLREIAAYFDKNITCDVLAVDAFRPDTSMEIFPIRVDAMVIVLCNKGHGRICIDLDTYELQPGSLLILHPLNYIQEVEVDDDFTSHTVMCSMRVVESVLPRLTAMLPFIMQQRSQPVINLNEDEVRAIQSFYTFVKLKLEGPATKYRKEKVLCMLQAALYEMMDIRLAHLSHKGQAHGRREEIMARFLIAVCENFRTERQVGFYARMLCISPKHLSGVVKETSGRTAGEWIDHYVIMEAKMLLGSTDMTIQEIASKLNFANQSFFGKYFKHNTGYSPTEFRRKQENTNNKESE